MNLTFSCGVTGAVVHTLTDDPTETLAETIRNTVAAMSASGMNSRQSIIAGIARSRGTGNMNDVLGEMDRMERAGEITRTPRGAYVLGRIATSAPADLELTSADPLFGQPSLF